MAKIAQRKEALDLVLQIVYNLARLKMDLLRILPTWPWRDSGSHSGWIIHKQTLIAKNLTRKR